MDIVQCYLLRTEAKETHTAVIIGKAGMNSRCGDKPWHRAEFAVDESYSFDDIRNRLPVKCMYCGQHEFNLSNSELAMSHSDTVYINPMTHKMSANIREVAEPGAMWHCPWLAEDGHVFSFLSDEYKRDWLGKRPPISVMLPGGSEWLIDQCAKGSGTKGWTVTGVPPILTAHPSIVVPGYHGWLENGVLRPA